MGLDMYLKVRKSVSTNEWNIERNAPQKNHQFDSLVSDLGLALFVEQNESYKWASVSVPVAYWRKANHIHNWFVLNVQDGDDNCLEHYVTNEKLAELRDLCAEVLATLDSDLLPLTDGFFFGSTEIDEWYWQELKYTFDRLDTLLKLAQIEPVDFYYLSSW
jgi:hypothetical protein